MRETTTVRAMLLALAFIAGFGAMLAMRRARAPFAAWSRVSGVHARRFLPAIWWTLAAADMNVRELCDQHRESLTARRRPRPVPDRRPASPAPKNCRATSGTAPACA